MEIAKEGKTVTLLTLIINFGKSLIYKKQKCVNNFKRDSAKMVYPVILLMVKTSFSIPRTSIKLVYVTIIIKETVKWELVVGMHTD